MQVNPQGPKEGRHRVVRGGSWNCIIRFNRVFHRDYLMMEKNKAIGFRLVMALENQKL